MKFINEKLDFDKINKVIDDISDIVSKNKGKSMCIALIGDLGTGKTAFAKRLLKNLGVTTSVKSPTFTYLIEYNTDIDIYHFDVYRISNEDDLYDIGFFDYIDQKGLTIIEWANLIPNNVPHNALYFEISHDDENTRYISIYNLKAGEKEYVDICNYNFD